VTNNYYSRFDCPQDINNQRVSEETNDQVDQLKDFYYRSLLALLNGKRNVDEMNNNQDSLKIPFGDAQQTVNNNDNVGQKRGKNHCKSSYSTNVRARTRLSKSIARLFRGSCDFDRSTLRVSSVGLSRIIRETIENRHPRGRVAIYIYLPNMFQT